MATGHCSICVGMALLAWVAIYCFIYVGVTLPVPMSHSLRRLEALVRLKCKVAQHPLMDYSFQPMITLNTHVAKFSLYQTSVYVSFT